MPDEPFVRWFIGSDRTYDGHRRLASCVRYGESHVRPVVRIGEASHPGPVTAAPKPRMVVQQDSHWIADDSEDERSSGNWSVEDMFGYQEVQRPVVGCEWHYVGDSHEDNRHQRSSIDDPEGNWVSESEGEGS